MKKKTTLLIIILSLVTSLSLRAAQAPEEIQRVLHQINSDGKLEISFDNGPGIHQTIDITVNPIGEDDEDMTVKTFLKTTHKSGRPFCFILCKTENNAVALLLADHHFYPLVQMPATFTELGKYQLNPGGGGFHFPAGFIFERPVPQPTVVVQHIPYPAPYPVHVEVPVFIDRVVTVPYLAKQPTTPPSTPFDQQATKGLQAIIASMPSRQESPAPRSLTPDQLVSPLETTIPRVDRILQRGEADSSSPDLFSDLTLNEITDNTPLTPSPVPPKTTKQKQRRKNHRSQTVSLSSVSETDEDILEQEIAHKAAQQQQAELDEALAIASSTAKALADRQEAAREQERIASSVALQALADKQKAEEDAKLRKIEAQQRKQEEQKIQEQKRREQAERDKTLAAEQKAAAQRKALEDQTAKAHAKKGQNPPIAKASAVTLTTSAQAKKKPAAADDDSFLETAMAQAAAQRAALPQQQASAPQTKKKAQRTLNFGQPDHESYFTPISQEEEDEEIVIGTIARLLDSNQHAEAKPFLAHIAQTNPLRHTTFLTDIYLYSRHLLTEQEIETLMHNSLKWATDKKVDCWYRCVLYFALAIHTKDKETKREFLDKCLELDKNKEHKRAQVLHQKIELEEYDSRSPLCKVTAKGCIHTRLFINVRFLEISEDFFDETIFLKIKLCIKALSGSCRQLKNSMENLKLNPRKELIDFYDTRVRQSNHSAEELAEINSLIPADIIPTDQLHRLP